MWHILAFLFQSHGWMTWRYWSMSKGIMHNTPTHVSEHLCLIWKESIKNVVITEQTLHAGQMDGQREWHQIDTPTPTSLCRGIINYIPLILHQTTLLPGYSFIHQSIGIILPPLSFIFWLIQTNGNLMHIGYQLGPSTVVMWQLCDLNTSLNWPMATVLE